MSEAAFRLACFALALLGLVLWERIAPAYARARRRGMRWPANFGLGLAGVLLVRVLIPAGAVGAAYFAGKNGIGLLHSLRLPEFVAIIVSILVLDLVVYFQHRIFHASALLWRVHRVHHADPELDVSSALRFHPVEILISMILKCGIVIAFGMPVTAVLVFEVILNAAAMFNHSNGLISPPWDARLLRILVTPSMHRIHHSTHRRDANTNFGFSVTWWDRVFGTYKAPTSSSRAATNIGLPDGPASGAHVHFLPLLLMPFGLGKNQRME